jgi:hypothetical protein
MDDDLGRRVEWCGGDVIAREGRRTSERPLPDGVAG